MRNTTGSRDAFKEEGHETRRDAGRGVNKKRKALDAALSAANPKQTVSTQQERTAPQVGSAQHEVGNEVADAVGLVATGWVTTFEKRCCA